MKRLLILLCAISIIISAGYSKTLIAYYSYTGNCRSIVNELKKQISADVLEIQPAVKDLKYDANNYALGTQLLNAINDNPDKAESYPDIDPVTVSVDDYSTIIIVTPLWWSQMAAIMQTFLFQYGQQMANKKLGLVVSSASSNISGVVADCKRLVPNADYCSENLWINNSNRANMPALVTGWVNNCQLNKTEENTMSTNVIVGGRTYVATLADNATAKAFAQMLPLTLNMSELNNNEKYCYLDSTLPTDTYRPGTINTGDIMLYGDNCIVLFYQTFSSSYSYTRLGNIDNPSGLAETVGNGNVTVSFTAAGTTSIDGINTPIAKQTDKAYDILGRPTISNPHGIVIINGKKEIKL